VMRTTPAFGTVSLADLQKSFLSLCAFAVFFMLSVVLNNASLANGLSLSINQLIKGTNPLPTLLFAIVLTRVVPMPSKVLTVCVVITGTCLAIPYGSPSATVLGMAYAVCSMLATSGRQAFSQFLMARTDVKPVDPLPLAFYQSVLAAPVLFLLWLLNVWNERHAVAEFWAAHPGQAIGMSTAISVSACAYTVVMFYFTRLTSAVTLTIAGSCKMVLLVVIPALIEPTTFSALNWVGAAVYFIGFGAYSYLGHRAVSDSSGTTEKTPLSAPLKSEALPSSSGCFRLCVA